MRHRPLRRWARAMRGKGKSEPRGDVEGSTSARSRSSRGHAKAEAGRGSSRDDTMAETAGPDGAPEASGSTALAASPPGDVLGILRHMRAAVDAAWMARLEAMQAAQQKRLDAAEARVDGHDKAIKKQEKITDDHESGLERLERELHMVREQAPPQTPPSASVWDRREDPIVLRIPTGCLVAFTESSATSSRAPASPARRMHGYHGQQDGGPLHRWRESRSEAGGSGFGCVAQDVGRMEERPAGGAWRRHDEHLRRPRQKLADAVRATTPHKKVVSLLDAGVVSCEWRPIVRVGLGHSQDALHRLEWNREAMATLGIDEIAVARAFEQSIVPRG